jgi:hypothetical protein
MNKADVVELLTESFSKGTSSPFVGVENREERVRLENEKLLDLIIEPVKVTARTNEWVRKFGEFSGEKYEMYVIAGKDQDWLLFNTDTECFSLAKGKLDEDLILIGFASDDALAEWRG